MTRKTAILFVLLLFLCGCTANKAAYTFTLQSFHAVDGRQGVCTEDGFYWVSGSATLTKYDSEWNVVAENTDPFKELELEVNHIGDIDVFNNEAFISQLRIRERTFAVVEIEKGTYIKTDALLQLDRPIDASVFKDYIDAALDFMVDGTPYTIRSLVLDGFVHPLDTLREDMGFGDYFYASVLSQAYVGGRVKIATINGIKVFCECSGTFSSPAFLESILKDLDAVEVDELAGLLEDKYGIEVGTAYLRNTVKRSSLYYNESIDMVFSSVEVYARKVDEWI